MQAIAIKPQEVTSLTGISPLWSDWLVEQDLTRLVQHPLLVALARNEVSLASLKTMLIQHSHYSRHFTRYLCALMGQLEHAEDVLALMDNMREEMGVDGQDRITHAELYQRALRVLGVSTADEAALPETAAMARTMLDHCQNSDALVGLAALCLGAEAIVPLIYRPILQALEHKGYGEDVTEFFKLHIEEDEDHALTMLAIMQRLIQGDEKRHALATRIGRELIDCRIAMFDAIWAQSLVVAVAETGHREQASRFSSADFWRVPSRLQARLPERLSHSQVMQASDQRDATFSSQRKHKVHIVDLPSHSISMTLGRLDVTEATRLHRHNYETLIYVIQGEGYSRIGDRNVPWCAGDAFYVPVWAEHQHVNTGGGECVYLACENAPMLQNLGGIALREELGPVHA
ncbi:iron-containing redox enzyme family protein [Pseudomonas sp. MH9.3]|uniref:iron-containing redox enzyme family protein n=1 Tax=Pseudomonas sp. MH9.3 TaxID=3048630 RepID=UPI002AC92E0D|nr:iron-containing redox enzyme family protein [Pseudomonas sp. MH9.3]MEB0106258.1 iron-containing redox enzyme family protein [Pseudomonas sp. MH9.3]WPX78577.1 iron-containing redox enzyme family protein [Pseudomonas sp. MH9.3]